MQGNSLNSNKDITFIPFSPQVAYPKIYADRDDIFGAKAIPNFEEVIICPENKDSSFLKTLEALQNITGYLEDSLNNLEDIDVTANNIYSLIEKENPSIMQTLKAYNLPLSISKIIITRVITLTLLYGRHMTADNHID